MRRWDLTSSTGRINWGRAMYRALCWAEYQRRAKTEPIWPVLPTAYQLQKAEWRRDDAWKPPEKERPLPTLKEQVYRKMIRGRRQPKGGVWRIHPEYDETRDPSLAPYLIAASLLLALILPHKLIGWAMIAAVTGPLSYKFSPTDSGLGDTGGVGTGSSTVGEKLNYNLQ